MLSLQEKIQLQREVRDLEIAIQVHKLGFHDSQDNGTTKEWREYGRSLVRKVNAIMRKGEWKTIRDTAFDNPKDALTRLLESCGVKYQDMMEFADFMDKLGKDHGMDRESASAIVLKDSEAASRMRGHYVRKPIREVVPQTPVQFTAEDASLLAELGAE